MSIDVASRLQGVTKQFGVPLVLSRASYSELEFPRNYLIREIDRIRVEDRQGLVGIFEVFETDPPDRVARKRQSLAQIAQIVSRFRKGDLEECITECRMVLMLNTDDEVARRYLKRCRRCPQVTKSAAS